ncbi:electron transfer flavoprotein-ubiquinone oxidoreductase [Oceanimonas baumannii]|uniref:Electron transfer flavoprotein-ubiquinone oxidoreductase n=1 Tax=Oceanimonas baumannii TaxID=129578 RepID=A0A235CNM3_9GAMM|nr:electron transfer flavoprotein-ubiquinone oxidoreductase [Oceanimonas baumannii]OYD25455.1 electron transfer flavoprotein-ubiquinone oxidoreductase [Oceanimonas baumannii]TDW61347.1 electron-transferring-flavoprotein dehydrogenase [Oceanimonas baumannii]
MKRESMEFDVVIVGAGPAGLSAACSLMQRARQAGLELNVCLVEKGAEVGAHILSGALFDTRALSELFPDWREQGAPVTTRVNREHFYMLSNSQGGIELPAWLTPSSLHNKGSYIISLGKLCRWLATQAEALGVAVFPGFAAREALFDKQGAVCGVLTGDMGLAADGTPKTGHMPGMELRARYTLFAEGSRGHLGKSLIDRFALDRTRDPQHYAIGFKELWRLAPERHQPGLVIHGGGWPLGRNGGGFFLYHGDDGLASVGLVMDLNYQNTHLDPFKEFQQLKHHPLLARHLWDGKRQAWGARALTKGGLNSLPEMVLPGALLLGCDAGTLNGARIKGIHTAMKSGLLAAEALVPALSEGRGGDRLAGFEILMKESWLQHELERARHFVPALHKLGPWAGGAANWLSQNMLRGRLPFSLHDKTPDHAALKPAASCDPVTYPRADGVLAFDRMSSVHAANTGHDEDQPCHLQLTDPALPLQDNLARYNEPAQRYCPAGVYEVLQEAGLPVFRINAANCVHCKTCDIKDPAQNITWVPPEGGSGPNYSGM